MIVRYWMTASPQTATEEMNLQEALALMNRHKIRRLPVMRQQELCGIVTLSDLSRFIRPSDLRDTLIANEAGNMLTRQKVGQIMTPQPLTCHPHSPLEEVGELMRNRKVGALPVMQEDRLIGIITESDILRAFVSITRAETKGKRVCFRIPAEDKADIIVKLVALCYQYHIEILTLLTHPLPQEQALMVMMRFRGDKEEQFIDALWKKPYQILVLE